MAIPQDQNSQEWLDYRKSRIGSSDIPAILGISPWCTPYQLWRQKLGFAPPPQLNAAMRRGNELEPVVRKMVEDEVGCSFPDAVVEHRELPWAIASLDGINRDFHGHGAILEIKCPNRDTHQVALDGDIPEHYLAQVRWAMFVADQSKAVYASYNPDARKALAIVIVAQDYDWVKDVALPAATNFYRCMVEMEEPERCERDVVWIDSPYFAEAARQWIEAKRKLDAAQQDEKVWRQALIDQTDDSDCAGPGVVLRRVNRQGSIDWTKLHADLAKAHPGVAEAFHPDQYRGEQIGYWKISEDKRNG